MPIFDIYSYKYERCDFFALRPGELNIMSVYNVVDSWIDVPNRKPNPNTGSRTCNTL